MKNIYLLSNQTKTSVSQHLDSISNPSRRRVLPIILLFLTAFNMQVLGTDYSIITTIESADVVSGSSYQAHSYSATDVGGDTIDWVITFGGNNKSVGTNSTKRSNCNLGSYTKYAVSPVTSSKVASAFVSTSVISDVSKISYTFNGGSNQTSTNVYLIYSSNGTSFSQISLTSGEQGASISSGTEYEFTKCSGYFGLLFEATNSSGNWRIDDVNISIYKEDAICSKTVTITKGAETNGTYTLSATSICGDAPGGTVNISAITPADGFEFDEITTSASGTVDNTNKRVTGITANTTITVKFKALPTYAIRFFNNGTQVGSTQNLPAGAIAVKPSDPAACDEGYSFVGWWTDELAEDNTTAETWITDFTVSGAQDYYAVFSKAGTGGSTVNFDATAPDPATKSGITLSVTGGALDNGTDYRVWKNQTMTISSSIGDMSSITLVFENAANDGGGWPTSYTPNAASWTSPTASGEQAHITNISVSVGTTYYTTDCGSACSTPTLTFDAATVNKFVGDAAFRNNLTITGNTLGADLTYTSSNPLKATVDDAGNVTILDAMSNEPITITARLAKKTVGLDCQKAVQTSYTLNIYNRVTWSVNGAAYTAGDPTQQAVEGGTITAYPTDPDGATACGGKTFVGWTDAPYPESDTKPSTLYTSLASMSSVHITDNTTFYAVFAEVTSGGANKFKRITTDAGLVRATGTKIVIISNVANKILQNDFTAVTAPTPDGDGVITVTDNQIWTLTDEDADHYWSLISGGVQLGVEATGGYTSGYYECGNYSTNASYWHINHANDFSGTADCFYLYNWSNGTWFDGLEFYGGSTNKWESVYFASANSNFINYCAMQIYGPYASYAAYSTTCGPNIKADEVERLTSTQGQIVKSQAITIKGSSLTGGTLSVKSITGDASQFACVLASQTITAGAIETTYTITYTPTVYDATHTAEIIFWDGTTESDPITLRGRSLPEHFAIVAYDGANYYALDGSMSGTASTVRAIPVTVTAGVVDYCPSRGIYSLTDLDTPDQNVHLTSATGRLYGEGGGTGLNIHSFTSLSGTGWLLTTTDFVNYHVTNATTTTRGIMYNSSNDVLGHYATSNYGKANYFGEIQFLPYADVCTCLDAPQNVVVVAKATRATITWDEVADATGYEVICLNASTSAPEGSISVDATNRTATITSLTNQTNYNFTVKAVAVGSDCSLAHAGHFRTTNCDDVPYGIRVTPAINSATFKWSMEAASATIQIFSDEECTSQVGSDYTGLTSPATITGLEDNTQYYAKILAGGTCESGVIDFQTNSPSVEIAEWFPDSIRIIIDANADASVIIEDKQEHGSTTVNYADKLFISKYFEADGNNKMIAIYNGTPDTIDITDMWLKHSNKGGSETKICLKKFGKKKGKIAPNEEIIIMRYSTETDPAKTCAEKEDNYDEWNIIHDGDTDGNSNNIYSWLCFSGPQSIGLYDGSTNKFIDVIGATTNNAGTGSLVQIEASNSVHCSYTENSNNDGSGFFANGKDIRNGNDIVLSTNRCLLIRKNTVKSGDDAVANNVYTPQEDCSATIGHAFTTLGDEWMGFIIGAGAHAADSTCVGLAYVGGFDYNGYYTTYDSIGGIKDLTGQQNDDGTYTIKIKDLDTLSCSTMRIKVYEGTEVKAQREYQVPIMVEDTKMTTDTIFQNKWHDLTTCETCDVVILKGATLTKAIDGTAKDAATVGDLTIYPGGTLNIPNSRTFNVASIQFRVEGENVPFIKLSGMLHTSDQQVLVSRRIDNSEAYFFSLPYDCNISDIRWSNGVPAILDDGFRIKEYDSRARADEGSTKGAPGHWKMVTGSKLDAGKGYQISVNSKHLKELIFPLDLGKTNVSDAENEKAPHGDNVVAIHQYTNGATTINNHNWNFIAQPYLCAMSPMAGDAITYGYLEYEIEEVAGEQQVVWYRRMEGNQYLTIYNPSTKTYDQILSSAVPQLDPFLAFFVQGKAEGTFTFDEGHRLNNAPARHLASQAEVDDDPSIFVGVTLSGNGLTDQANLRVRQDFTEDEYKLGYDLLKFTTYYKDRPQVYMKTPSYQLAFQAVSDSVAKNTWLPMGVYCYKPGTYTFGLSNDYPIDEVEAVYLYDKVTGVTTNLLYDTYTITTSSQLYTNTRFALNVIVNRREPQVTTDTGLPEAPDNMVRKILINGHVYIQRGAAIYDITGKQMLNF